MPQATDEERAWAVKAFGSLDCGAIEAWLKERGYTLRPDWCWELPRPSYIPTQKESRAIAFLIDEWDYGDLIKEQLQ